MVLKKSMHRFLLCGLSLCTLNIARCQETYWAMTNVAGNGTTVFVDGNDALESGMQPPSTIDVDSEGNVYFVCAHPIQGGIFRIDHTTDEITKILNKPFISGLALGDDGKIYFSVGGTPPENRFIYWFDPIAGTIDTLAGKIDFGIPIDGVDARETPIGYAGGIKIDPSGEYLYYTATLYETNFIQRINLTTNKTYRVAGIAGIAAETDVPDGTDALSASLNLGLGLAWDVNENLYFSTGTNRIKMIKKVGGTIVGVAGTGEEGKSGDGGLATNAKLDLNINGFAINEDNVLFITETGNADIRRISLNPADADYQIITTVCGTGYNEGSAENPSGDLDNGEYKEAIQTNINPTDIIVVSEGLILTDNDNRIRKIFRCTDSEITSSTVSQTAICKGDTVKLSFSGSLNDAEAWTWYKDGCGEGTSVGSGMAITIIADETQNYYARSTGGCSRSADCEVVEVNVNCKPYFNTFTPNEDGINDFFELPIVENFPVNTVTIYNRWGDVLETIENYDNAVAVWKGTNGNGDPVDSGTYYFTAVANGEVLASGWVELIK